MKGYNGDNYHQTLSVYPRAEHTFRPRRSETSREAARTSGDLDLARTALGAPPTRLIGGATLQPNNHGNNVTSLGSNWSSGIQPWPAQAAAPAKPPAAYGAAANDVPFLANAPAGDDKPAAAPTRGSGLEAVQMSLQDMLAAAARIQSELMASSSSVWPSTGPTAVAAEATASAEVATAVAAPLASAVPCDDAPNTTAIPQTLPTQRAQAASQPRGPLEALRDELFGSLSLPSPRASVRLPVAPPASPAAPQAPPVVPVPASASTTPLRMVRSAPGVFDTVAFSSPAASAVAGTDEGGISVAPLHEEMSALTAQAGNSYADLSSIYSIPDSALNATARTPMSFTTAAVSELDTPSSLRSRDDEYDKSFASPNSSERSPPCMRITAGRPRPNGRLEYERIASGYDDYVSPASWMSLREQHSTSQARGKSTMSCPGGTTIGGRGDGSMSSTPTSRPVPWTMDAGIDLFASGTGSSPSMAAALPEAATAAAQSAASYESIDMDGGQMLASGRSEYAQIGGHRQVQERNGQQQFQHQNEDVWVSSPDSGYMRPDPVVAAMAAPPPSPEPEPVAAIDALALDTATLALGQSEHSTTPTGFGSSVVSVGADTGRGQDRTVSSDRMCRSLSFGVPSGTPSVVSSRTESRYGDDGAGGGGCFGPTTGVVTLPADGAFKHQASPGVLDMATVDPRTVAAAPLPPPPPILNDGDAAAVGEVEVDGSGSGTAPGHGDGDGGSGGSSGNSTGDGSSSVEGVGNCRGVSGSSRRTPPLTAREHVSLAADDVDPDRREDSLHHQHQGQEEEARDEEEAGEEEEEKKGEEAQEDMEGLAVMVALPKTVSTSATVSGSTGAPHPRHACGYGYSYGDADSEGNLQPRLARTSSSSKMTPEFVEDANPSGADGGIRACVSSSAVSLIDSVAGTENIRPLPIGRPPSLATALAPASPPTTAGGAAVAGPNIEGMPTAAVLAAAPRPPLPRSGVSAAALGAVPEQDREELVRSWAHMRADFRARPQVSSSSGGGTGPGGAGAALTPGPSRDGSVVATADSSSGGGGGDGFSAWRQATATAGLVGPEALLAAHHAPPSTPAQCSDAGVAVCASSAGAAAATVTASLSSIIAPAATVIVVPASFPPPGNSHSGLMERPMSSIIDDSGNGLEAGAPAAVAAAEEKQQQHLQQQQQSDPDCGIVPTAATFNTGWQYELADPLDHLLSLLAGRGAPSEAQGQLLLSNTLRSAVFEAVSQPRPNSAPMLVNFADGHGLARATAPAMPLPQQAAAAAKASAVCGDVNSDGPLCPSVPVQSSGHEAALLQVAQRAADLRAVLMPVINACGGGDGIATAVSQSMSRTPLGAGLSEQPHPHFQPYLPVNMQSNLSRQQQKQQQSHLRPSQQQQSAGLMAGTGVSPQGAVVPNTIPPAQAAGLLQPISPCASLGSIDSEVAAERLKAKMRAYLQNADAGGATAAAAAAAAAGPITSGGSSMEPESSGVSSASAMAATMWQQQQQPLPRPPASSDSCSNGGGGSSTATRLAAADVSAVDVDSLDSLLQQATQHLQVASDPAAAAAGVMQPSLSALEDILRQLRDLTRSSSGGSFSAAAGGPPLPARPPPPRPPPRPMGANAQTATASNGGGSTRPISGGMWSRQVHFSSVGGAGGTSSNSSGGGSVSVNGGGLIGSSSNISVGCFSGTSAGSNSRGADWSAGGHRLQSSVGSVSFWAPSTATNSSPPGPSRRSRAVSSPSRLGLEAAVAAPGPAAATAAGDGGLALNNSRGGGSSGDGGGMAAARVWETAPYGVSYPGAEPQYTFSYPAPYPTQYQGAVAAPKPECADGNALPGSKRGGAVAAAAAAAEGHRRKSAKQELGIRWACQTSSNTYSSDAGPMSGGGGASGPLQEEGPSYLELTAQAAKLREKVALMGAGRQSPSSQHQRQPQHLAEAGQQSPTRRNTDIYGSAARSRSPHYDLIGKQNHDQQQLLWPAAATATATVGRAVTYGGGGAAGQAERAGSAPVDWHAALQSKLIPYDVVRSRESLIDAAATLWVPAPPGAYAAAPPPPPQPGSGGGAGNLRTVAVGTTTRQSRPPSPAIRGSSMGSGVGPAAGIIEGAAARSAPVTPRRANSPARSPLAPPQQPQQQPYGSNSAMPSKSPRAARAGSSGSILDRATPHPSGGGAAAGNNGGGGGGGGGSRGDGSPPPMRPASPVPSEPITIVRPFAWQERETRLWLDDLGLAVSPTEESLPLLDNPLRNGLLLAALAARVVGSPLPTGVVTAPPRDVRSARTNILCALDHLGLLAAPWGPPPDAERRARAQAVTVSDTGSGGTAGNTTAGSGNGGGSGGGGSSSNGGAAAATATAGGRSRSPSPSRNAAKGPTTGSSGIIAIKALGSAGRGYALRLKERQLRAGLGLIAEVESVLAGSADSIWGLLNFIRLAVAPQYLYLRGSGNGTLAAAAAATGQRPWGNMGPQSDEPTRR
ncbi:hypothetical protein Vretimale_7218, partial [Volvox reticuliferus]